MKSLLLFGIFFSVCTVRLDAQVAIYEQEPDLRILLDSLRASTTDEAKTGWNEQFRTLLEKTLQDPAAFTYPFSQLQTLGKIDSPDGLIRIFSWNIEMADESQFYCAFVLRKNENKPGHKVFELTDNSAVMMVSRTDEVLEGDNWYGALYYKIIPVAKNNKTYYTLLGWDGASTASNIKLLDVLYFSANGVKLGYPLFKSGSETRRRVYFEHSQKSTMSLRWDEDHNRIMFDHLSPETPTMEGFYEYYVPDMSYDAYEYQETKWVLIEDVIGVNKGNAVVHVNHLDEKTGDVEEEIVENRWIDPTTEGSPASKEVHTAVTPESAAGASDKASREKEPKTAPKNALENYNNGKRPRKEKEPGSSYLNGGKRKYKRK